MKKQVSGRQWSAILLGLVLLSLQGALRADDGQLQQKESAGSLAAVETVNVNQADAMTIARMLDGIGKSRAEAIVKHREEFGEFRSLDDLTLVQGVGLQTVIRNEARISFD